MDCAPSGSYLLLFDHNRRLSQLFFLPKARFLHHFSRSCGVSLKIQSQLTKSRCSNISHFLAPLGIPCSTVHHFDCSVSLPPLSWHLPSHTTSTDLHSFRRPGLKLRLHLLVTPTQSCPSSLVLRHTTIIFTTPSTTTSIDTASRLVPNVMLMLHYVSRAYRNLLFTYAKGEKLKVT